MGTLFEVVRQLVNPAYVAAICLVAIQVGMGVLFKAVQNNGEYSFSISASITISEFFKLCLSSIFFYRTCWRRHQNTEHNYQQLSEEEPLSRIHESATIHSKDSSSDDNDDGEDKEFVRMSLDGSTSPSWATESFSPLLYLKHCYQEINKPTVLGYGHLALLYAAINNTVFVLFRLADPGTIQLIKSGITLATALVLMFTLGTRITQLQWVAIGFQVCGLIVTQYHPGTGSLYPFSTYVVLLSQTCVAAVAGVFNQHLLKSQQSSMHAQNMVLYAFGVLINLIVHFIVAKIRPQEPGMFDGFNHVGAILVIISNVLNGLAITAVYKYADAIVKCFATAFSTAILLYVSPLMFNASFSFLIIPGTVVVFTATWLYMDSSPPKQTMAGHVTNSTTLGSSKTKASGLKRKLLDFMPHGRFALVGLLITTSMAITGIAGLTLWDSWRAERDSNMSDVSSSVSPFRNTVAIIRSNYKERVDRFPLLEKYRPFFHTLHISIPDDRWSHRDGNLLLNTTFDTWDDHRTVYTVASRIMELALNDSQSTVEGLLWFHFDLWINPMLFNNMDFNVTWFPVSPDPPYLCYTDLEVGARWGSFNPQSVPIEMPQAIARLNRTKYNHDGKMICQGWADLFYIPRRFFRDWIELSTVMYPAFHEVAVPTMVNILDRTYRSETEPPVLHLIGDCWGHCCAKWPTKFDIEYCRCGHKLNYQNPDVTQIHYDRLDRQARDLDITKTAAKAGPRQSRKRSIMELVS